MAKKDPHPDVHIRHRTKNGKDIWSARWIDPDTGERREQYFKRLKLTTPAARKRWAILKQKEILDARLGLVEPKPREIPRTAVKDAVDEFLDRREGALAKQTIANYRTSGRILATWCEEHAVGSVSQLTPKVLDEFRDDLLKQKARVAAKGEAAGAKVVGKKSLSAYTVSKVLTHVKTFLRKWRRMELLEVSWDDVQETLKKARGETRRITFLRREQVQDLLRAAMEHDEETYAMTREEKRVGLKGMTRKYHPIAPFLLASVLAGTRAREMSELPWSEVSFEEDAIHLDAARVKTKNARSIPFDKTPKLRELLKRLEPDSPRAKHVFGPKGTALSLGVIQAARKRLISEYDAPVFDYPMLRRTCGTYLTCAPGIYGAASATYSAKRLGHSVTVAERHYVGLVSDISFEADTLEKVLGIEDLAKQIIERIPERKKKEHPSGKPKRRSRRKTTT